MSFFHVSRDKGKFAQYLNSAFSHTHTHTPAPAHELVIQWH